MLKYSGTIFSPDYPVPYPDDEYCLWRFLAPIGKRVKLKFVDFELRGSSYDDCNYNFEVDHISIDRNSRSIGWSFYCGKQTAFEVYSAGIEMHVRFHAISDGVRGKRGFKAHFEAVDPRDLTGI